MRTQVFRNTIFTAFIASSLSLAQQYPAPQYPPPQQQYPQQQQQQYPPQQQPQYPAQQPQQPYPQQQYPQYPQQQSAYNPPPPPPQSPQQLQQEVGPIALYPDGLLAQVLTASTYPEQIPDAAGWANQHAYLHGDALANAMRADNLQFAPAVMALLPFPQVLSYMAGNMGWTTQLGNAVLVQRADVMDAVQYMRYQAYNYGYLRDPQFAQYERVVLAGPRTIEILPANPGLYYVPAYNPLIVYAPLRPHAYVGGFFSFGFGGGISIGAAFSPWGWGGVGFGWREHSILVDNRPWDRTYVNRGAYVHPYAQPYRPAVGPRTEGHTYRPAPREEHREEHHDR
jgi:hypothetical protein